MSGVGGLCFAYSRRFLLLSERELSKAIEYVKANYNDIVAEWYRHFGL
jgi:hypothetical protein